MLNDRCFDICFPDARLANKMDGKSQTCLANCVNSKYSSARFMKFTPLPFLPNTSL